MKQRILSVLRLRPSYRWGFVVVLLAMGLVMVTDGPPVAAQATRTWVSGVGDDANPCSRTAPCKTFPGAISKTAAGGEINCLDPGGFGAVTITKSISIDCTGQQAGVLVVGTNAIVINALSTDVVRLKGLDINGFNNSLIGIKYIAGAAVFVEDCWIYGFNGGAARGIEVLGSNNAAQVQQLYVKNTRLWNNGINIVSGGGIILGNPAAPNAGPVRATLDNVHAFRNNIGLRVSPAVESTVKNSFFSGNISFNVFTASGGGAAIINMDQIDASESVGGTGLRAEGPGALIRVGNSTVFGNNVGLQTINGGVITSLTGNQVQGNFGGNGAFTNTVVPQ